MSLSHGHALRQLPDVNAVDSNVLWSKSTAESEGHQNRRLLQPFFTGFFLNLASVLPGVHTDKGY